MFLEHNSWKAFAFPADSGISKSLQNDAQEFSRNYCRNNLLSMGGGTANITICMERLVFEDWYGAGQLRRVAAMLAAAHVLRALGAYRDGTCQFCFTRRFAALPLCRFAALPLAACSLYSHVLSPTDPSWVHA